MRSPYRSVTVPRSRRSPPRSTSTSTRVGGCPCVTDSAMLGDRAGRLASVAGRAASRAVRAAARRGATPCRGVLGVAAARAGRAASGRRPPTAPGRRARPGSPSATSSPSSGRARSRRSRRNALTGCLRNATSAAELDVALPRREREVGERRRRRRAAARPHGRRRAAARSKENGVRPGRGFAGRTACSGCRSQRVLAAALTVSSRASSSSPSGYGGRPRLAGASRWRRCR